MRAWIIPFCLFIFCFVLPIQFFFIGTDTGMGIQGALYRYQMTTQGNSLIPITNEISYVTDGLYSGRSAFSIVFWVLGTVILIGVTAFTLIQGNGITQKQLRTVIIGLAGAGTGYLASCIAQYGPLLKGSAGTSIPLGVFVIIAFAVFLHKSRIDDAKTE
jgi:hypothetical protein